MKTKEQLRREMEELRKNRDPSWCSEASRRIIGRLQELEVFRSARRVSLYKHLPGEVELEDLFDACWKLDQQTCMPVFNRTLRIYELAAIDARTRFRTGHYGIREPEERVPVSLDQVNLMIVPGVAFDVEGNRLGRGGGYYDRLLAGFRGVSVAVAFDFQIVPRLPTESHDIPVDLVVTESKLLKVQNEH